MKETGVDNQQDNIELLQEVADWLEEGGRNPDDLRRLLYGTAAADREVPQAVASGSFNERFRGLEEYRRAGRVLKVAKVTAELSVAGMEELKVFEWLVEHLNTTGRYGALWDHLGSEWEVVEAEGVQRGLGGPAG